MGDAPKPYFFKLLYAKRIRETIKILTTLDGRSVENEDEILHEVYDHYHRLYTKDNEVDFYQLMRDKVLSLIDAKFTDEDNVMLKVVLDDDEIQRIVFSFPWEKSPGGDSVTNFYRNRGTL